MLTRRSLLAAAALPAAGADSCPASVAFITDESAPHLNNYLTGLAATRLSPIGVAGAAGETRAAAEKAFAHAAPRFFATPAELFAAMRPSLTIVSVAAHHGPTTIRAALSAGSHVLAEKPACVRAQDFEPLVKLAGERRLSLMLAFANRTNPLIERARALVSGGAIGRPVGVQALYIADQTRLTRPAYQKSWFADRALAGGGHLAWLGIHYFDMLQFVTGQKIALVTALNANTGGQPLAIEDSNAVSFQLENGALGTLLSSYYLDKGNQVGLNIWGTGGWLRMNPAEPSVPLEWYSAKDGRHSESFPAFEVYNVAVARAIETSCGRRPAMISPAECLHDLRVVFSCYESAASGHPVRLPAGPASYR